MSDDSKPPKGPLLPDPKDPNRVDSKRTNVIDIKETLKERKDKRKGAKTDRRQQGKPEKEKPKKKIKTTVETVESHEPVDPVKKKQKEEREKFNDKKRMERLRAKVEGWLARFSTEVLPIRKNSAGNNPTKVPVHPLTSKMTGRDRQVSADTRVQPDAAQQLQLLPANQLTHQNQNQNTPKPKPPGL